MLQHAGHGCRLLLIDRDAEALARTQARLRDWQDECTFVHGNFADVEAIVRRSGLEPMDGMLFDIGISSDQLDTPERGFSFQHEARLDMRMDPSRGPTAEDLVNSLGEEELADVLWRYGEESDSRRIARAIAQARKWTPLRTTGQLAALIEDVKRGRHGKIHPATRTFMALRISVNDELEALRRGLAGGLNLLRVKGRIAVISFHRLEDAIVKHFFVRHTGRWESLPAGGRIWRCELPEMAILTKKPIVATAAEQERNPRARSAKLRVAERKG
jgi:16S rRNA (cytosine1402-N4)-methyltransferase